MDLPEADGEDLHLALEELGWINRHLGGHRAFLSGLHSHYPPGTAPPSLTVLDVGCGGGDIVAPLRDWAVNAGVQKLRIILLDFNRHTCRQISPCTGNGGEIDVQWIVLQADARHLPCREGAVDIIHFGLFLHHFRQGDIVQFLRVALKMCCKGLIVNDLHASRLPYWVTRWGTRILCRSTMVPQDGPLSILRGFHRAELQSIATGVGQPWTRLGWVWPFRWLGLMSYSQRSGS
ncbi:MAG: methyltransferase domain-containing protein [Gemmatimonadetes bacterium]|jgi:SAM-dependent methyltransferase|nr:methyltransferase domain-containing protein [Gemmatimonadota bacterium]MBT4612860.1 methyltransferase domain-containing protein [Gemmatimonadota bacterium]MBT5056502.1 methyltransferase domain-containing protein [Gemmatimonadota bacterium]MBT5142482.1 methyltransferase domain-containing protein [Gemmatimonadota bacterium]MBT5586412.1 methyltransferase domain-containing protein [Gemmatimonadota bacterium]